MRRNLNIFLLLSISSAKAMFQHRIGIISFVGGKIMRFTFYLLFIFFLITRTRLLAGYSLQQTILFFLTFNFIDAMSQLLFREVYRFRPLIVSGEFDSVLLKPYHPFLRILIGGIDIIDGITIIPYLSFLIYFVAQLHVHPLSLLLYSGFMVNALFLAAGFHVLILAIGIFTTEVDNVLWMYRDFIKMLSLPIDMYREPLRSFLMFAVPIGIMIAVPVKALFGLLTINMYVISIVISLLFIFFSFFLWNLALQKYQSWGG